MNTFLDDIAEVLLQKYRNNLGNLRIIIPNKRIRFFLTESFSKKITFPSLAPQYVHLHQLFEELSILTIAEPLTVLYSLYEIYKKYQQDNVMDFNTFFSFGEIMLSDFDAVDKYYIDAEQLFKNIKNYKNIDAELSYLTPEQIRLLKEFWNIMDVNPENRLKKEFATLWDMLYPVYFDLKNKLLQEKKGYEGMVQRQAIENLLNGSATLQNGVHYVAIGFNALTYCEHKLFMKMQQAKMIDFFWDYDNYYINNLQQEAGLLMRENIKHFPSSVTLRHDYFIEPKKITFISAPSDTLQAKHIHELLVPYQNQQISTNDVAVIFPDENLLLPALYAVPEGIEAVNVTMGYSFYQTPICQFIELLLLLHSHKREIRKTVMFYYKDVEELLSHTYLHSVFREEKITIVKHIYPISGTYITFPEITGQTLSPLLSPTLSATEFLDKLQQFLDVLTQKDNPSLSHPLNEDMIMEAVRLCNMVMMLTQTMEEISFSILQILFKKMVRSHKIAFEGKPLLGVQMMSLQETKALDFETVIILSANEGLLPQHNRQHTFIPYKIALGFGLPTFEQQEALYAYDFYRLIQRAKNVFLLYNSQNNALNGGEKSRYLLQLELETQHKITYKNLGLRVNVLSPSPIAIPKTDKVMEKLYRYVGTTAKAAFSATAINCYLTCPLQFYFMYVADIFPPQDTILNIDDSVLGTLLHSTVEQLYTPYTGQTITAEVLSQIINTPVTIDQYIESSMAKQFFKKEGLTDDEKQNVNVIILRHTIQKYIHALLQFHLTNTPFDLIATELKLQNIYFPVVLPHQTIAVQFKGFIDFLYHKENIYYITDIKTGRFDNKKLMATSIPSLFEVNENPVPKEIIQTFLYSLLYSQNFPEHRISPQLHFIRAFLNQQINTSININNVEVREINPYLSEFQNQFTALLSEIYNSEVPFTPTVRENVCQVCHYRTLCHKSS